MTINNLQQGKNYKVQMSCLAKVSLVVFMLLIGGWMALSALGCRCVNSSGVMGSISTAILNQTAKQGTAICAQSQGAVLRLVVPLWLKGCQILPLENCLPFFFVSGESQRTARLTGTRSVLFLTWLENHFMPVCGEEFIIGIQKWSSCWKMTCPHRMWFLHHVLWLEHCIMW